MRKVCLRDGVQTNLRLDEARAIESRWYLEAEGHDLVLGCLRRGQMGPFQLQAAIQAVHCAAPSRSAQPSGLEDSMPITTASCPHSIARRASPGP